MKEFFTLDCFVRFFISFVLFLFYAAYLIPVEINIYGHYNITKSNLVVASDNCTVPQIVLFLMDPLFNQVSH